MKQTGRAPQPTTHTLDQATYKKVWIAKPTPIWQGGEPEYLGDAIRDFLYSPAGNEVAVVLWDTISNWATQVKTKACIDTVSDKQRANKAFGGMVAPDKPQYMFTQMKVGQALYDLAGLPTRSIFLSHVANQTEDSIVGQGTEREKVTRTVYSGFRTEGRAQIEPLGSILSPGLVHLTSETKGFGANAKTEHTAWLQDHGNPPFYAKWQNTDAPASMSVEGREGCDAFWKLVMDTVRDNTFSIGIYSRAGVGKTTLALTLWDGFWAKDEGVALYVACDPSSEALPTAWPGTVR